MAFCQPITGDVDSLYGPRDAEGRDTYVPSEINVSSVMRVPDEAPAVLAQLAREKLFAKVCVSMGHLLQCLHISPG